MRLLKILTLTAVVTTFMVASTASALVTIDATTSVTGDLDIGATFDVDINVSWDGGGSLFSIFASHEWSNTQLQLNSAVFPLATQFETRPVLFAGGAYDPPGMNRFGTIAEGIAGDDLSSLARTVQYGALNPLNASQANSQLITRLTFEVIGVGDGIAEINGILAAGDPGAADDSLVFGSNVSVGIVPEPGTALLMGLGLAGLAAAGRREA